MLSALSLMAVLATSGCGGNALAPQFQPEVTNVANNFQFQTTGITNISQELQYTWSNSGLLASINHASAITSGTATLIIRDSAGATVYSSTLASTGTVSTSPSGVAGNWTITITLSHATGTINFRVQKL